MNRTLFASTLLVALSAMLAACEPVVGTANAAATEAPVVSTATVYFGAEYATVQQNLKSDSAPAAPTF